jgi:hypothetical protein
MFALPLPPAMKIHEYQAKEILPSFGVATPKDQPLQRGRSRGSSEKAAVKFGRSGPDSCRGRGKGAG